MFNQSNQNPEIVKAIHNYFAGYLEAEAETLQLAFHPTARLHASEDGVLETTELRDWVENLRTRKSKGDTRKAHVEILGIEVTQDAAVAKARFKFEKFTFTDYLSLLHLKTGWTIVNKIYTTETVGESK